MKNVLTIAICVFLIYSCANNSKKQEQNGALAQSEVNDTSSVQASIDANTTYVYYFHGKQRCKTCIAVEKVTKKTIDSLFSSEPKVRFLVVLTDQEANKELVKKYEIGWNSLIIAKGDNFVNITEEAFATAIKEPNTLVELIKKEVSNRL